MPPLFSQHRVMLGAAGLSGLIEKGWWGGGQDGAAVNTIHGLDFLTESTLTSSETIGTARYYVGGTSVSAKGYWGGGRGVAGGTEKNIIDDFKFPEETSATMAAVLSDGIRTSLGGVSNATTNKGYWGGGQINSATYYNFIDGINADTDAAINPSAVLSDGARSNMGVANSTTKGYWAGGERVNIATTTTAIDAFIFSTEAANNPSAVLATSRKPYGSGVSSDIRGYFIGGHTYVYPDTTYYTQIDGIRFDTDAAINPSAATSPAKTFVNCASGKSNGYIAGGSGATGLFTEIERFAYATETITSSVASLVTAMAGSAGLQQWPQV